MPYLNASRNVNIWIFPSSKPNSWSSFLPFLHSLFQQIAPLSTPENLRHHTKCFLIGNGSYCLTSPHSQFSIILHKFLSILYPTHLWNLVTSLDLLFLTSSRHLVFWCTTTASGLVPDAIHSLHGVFLTSDLCFPHLNMHQNHLVGVLKKKKDCWAPIPVLVQQVWGMAQRIRILTSSQIMLRLLVQDHILNTTLYHSLSKMLIWWATHST